MGILCRFAGHRRSRSHARLRPSGQWESVCKRCREPMVRVAPGEWWLKDEIDPPREVERV